MIELIIHPPWSDIWAAIITAPLWYQLLIGTGAVVIVVLLAVACGPNGED